MLIQICMDYSTLPPLSEITAEQIEFFYKPLIPGILKKQRDDIKNASKGG
jgi:hypothetical protein